MDECYHVVVMYTLIGLFVISFSKFFVECSYEEKKNWYSFGSEGKNEPTKKEPLKEP